ncbi:hypothetical protein HO133_008156 [Letharia lupina]|uniref:Protein kinase domain-containing protein n=1 Tax=Letharia lupina TaxID=560253 RepID=A0A8H6FHL0_9LECA|nr:uncharacterized protein HO133_008156 [Letharia lupina]KAF6228426.1 hypothetical protein HO133_008156 [Letharia lupina]
MVGSYSSHGDAGGTLHCPSPTHIHHVDPASAFRQLRRSLSRSPSKGPAFRLVTSKSTSPSPSSPLSHSREPPPNRSTSASMLSPTLVSSPSSLAFPYPYSARKIRPATRKLSPMRNPSRSNSIQRSPRKRTLSESRNPGNATPQSSAESSDDQENRNERSVSPAEDSMPDVIYKANAPPPGSSPFAPARATRNFEKGNSWGAKSSPLKRSDGIMNLDQGNPGSPSRKRRSLHGGMFNTDFNIFDHEAAFEEHDEPSTTDSTMSMDSSAPVDHLSAVPKRTSSLRRTTLQQRHDKPLFARSKPNTDLALEFATPGHASQKSRLRMSLDSVLPSMARDSPFSSQGCLPNASAHPMSQHGSKQTGSSQTSQPQRHPLSRTLSQSTSNSSMAEDSPTHIPIRQPEQRRTFVDFSKSLPVGAARPSSRDGESSSQVSSGTSFATPENYKLVKPLPAAFMSTGLISKRHKNVEDTQAMFGASKNSMPDTPCKRHSLAEMPSPSAPRENTFAKAHHTRHSFGTPSTPFNPHTTRLAPETFGKGVSIFGSNMGGSLRRTSSFLNTDIEELQSPPRQDDSQSSAECDIPPTPTKQAGISGSAHQTPFGGSATRKDFASAGFGASVGAETQSFQHEQDSSPLNDRMQHLSPHTPKGSMIPPDPSGLSISAHANEQLRPMTASASSASMYPPATPTAPRDSFASFKKSTSSMTPPHGSVAVEIDPVLTSRFDKVDLIGTGEFSQVYRVTQKQELKGSQSYFSIPQARTSPRTPLPDRVWAVKKSRNAYIGPKDRQRKLQEVNTLKALGHSDHTVQLFDSWEDKNHLYIQTEFCEEGSLDSFLDQVGRKARLDDFRIWKILLELSRGLKHIHDSGFIHLDLKPANVLITFEGVLKIADFGMATRWPAQPGIDGEGDREYIGPEILRGHFDKPGDVFALGLIMLEIAGNVMLPDNGASWQRLRTGDMSDVPSLTWSSGTSSVLRDSLGKPLSQDASVEDFYGSDSGEDDFGSPKFLRGRREKEMKNGPFKLHRSGELAHPPAFMIDSKDPEALDNIVRWMISPETINRPVVDQVLGTIGVQWAESRRRAGATIFEGNWGPADEVLADDAEMIDV